MASDDSDEDDFGPMLPPVVKPVTKRRPPPGMAKPIVVEARECWMPTAAKLQLNKSHSGQVSAIALDSSGSRMLVGGHDYNLSFWDFSGMDSTLSPFRNMDLESGNPVRSLSFSPCNSLVLAVSSSSRPRIIDKSGYKHSEPFVAGDMYVLDLSRTAGHVSGCTGGVWSHTDPNIVYTSSLDGTVRMWDVNSVHQNLHVLRCRTERGGIDNIAVNALGVSPDAATIAAATIDGAIHLWDARASRYSRPTKAIRGAHIPQVETSGITFARDAVSMYTRGGGENAGTVKLWDLRNLKSPVCAAEVGAHNRYLETNVCLSPDQDLVLSGTPDGEIIALHPKTLQVERRVSVCSGVGVVKVEWHPILNQIVAGCADGGIRVLYDPDLSRNGVLLSANKKSRKKTVVDQQQPLHIITPHSLPMYRQERGRKRQRERDRMDPVIAKIPERPVVGAGHGGRVGVTQTQIDARAFIPTTLSIDQDPREELLKYAAEIEAGDGPLYSIPETIFAEVDEDE